MKHLEKYFEVLQRSTTYLSTSWSFIGRACTQCVSERQTMPELSNGTLKFVEEHDDDVEFRCFYCGERCEMNQ